MWIVRLAVRLPYTFTVMAILILLVGVIAITRMSTDIFPNINIPVVSVIWSYPGVAPEEMEKRFVTVCERAMTTTVNDIEHIESQSYNGVAGLVYFHEGAKVEAGVAQVTSVMRMGDRIEVLDGLKENTKVVVNPTDDLRDGIQVEVKSTEETKPISTVA